MLHFKASAVLAVIGRFGIGHSAALHVPELSRASLGAAAICQWRIKISPILEIWRVM
jgi:hypothetical protein